MLVNIPVAIMKILVTAWFCVVYLTSWNNTVGCIVCIYQLKHKYSFFTGLGRPTGCRTLHSRTLHGQKLTISFCKIHLLKVGMKIYLQVSAISTSQIFHLPDLPNLSFFNINYTRRKFLSKSTCPSGKFTCPGPRPAM